MDGKVTISYVASILISVAMLVYGVMNDHYVVFTMSAALLVLASLFLYISIKKAIDPKIAMLCAILLLISSIIAIQFPYDPEMVLSESGWAHAMGAVYWIMSFSLAALVLQAIAVIADAKYNYPLTAGFMVFISGGLTTVAMVIVSYMNKPQIEEFTITSLDLLSALFVNLLLSCIAAIVIAFILRKKRFVLSRSSCEVLE